MDIAAYITGFTEGEGCFCVSFNFRQKLNTGIEVRPSFSISQHKRNLEVLKKVESFFQCGGIRYSKRDQNYKYEVRGIDDLHHVIIPHFKQYRLIGAKAIDFDKFAEICEMVRTNHHRNPKHLSEIIEIAYEINHGHRKFDKNKLLQHLAR